MVFRVCVCARPAEDDDTSFVTNKTEHTHIKKQNKTNKQKTNTQTYKQSKRPIYMYVSLSAICMVLNSFFISKLANFPFFTVIKGSLAVLPVCLPTTLLP